MARSSDMGELLDALNELDERAAAPRQTRRFVRRCGGADLSRGKPDGQRGDRGSAGTGHAAGYAWPLDAAGAARSLGNRLSGRRARGATPTQVTRRRRQLESIGDFASQRLRATANLSSRIKVIWVVQSPSQKYFPFSSDPNHFYIPRHPGPLEGRFAIVTNVGQGCGGRGCALGERREADGEVVWS